MSRPLPQETEEIARILRAVCVAGEATAKALPASPGAYGLLFRLTAPVTVPVTRLGSPVLERGLYLYCGSARGPGGTRARLSRHLRQDKRLRWHIDHLSSVAVEIAGLAVPHVLECDLGDRARTVLKAEDPVPGFGASDCRRCVSHLLKFVI
jgi:Uri superfamily endonuclease